MHKTEKPSIWSTVHLLLIHVHVQVNLGAQVKVEEGVHAEHEEQDCRDDQERILRRKQRFKNIFKMFLWAFFLFFCPNPESVFTLMNVCFVWMSLQCFIIVVLIYLCYVCICQVSNAFLFIWIHRMWIKICCFLCLFWKPQIFKLSLPVLLMCIKGQI